MFSLYGGSTASLLNTSFEGNTLFDDRQEGFEAARGAVVAVMRDFGDGFSPVTDSSQVRLENCTFADNFPSMFPKLIADNTLDNASTGVFYSEDASPEVCTLWPDEEYEPVYIVDDDFKRPCIYSSPKPLQDGEGAFLQSSNAWWVNLKQVKLSHQLA